MCNVLKRVQKQFSDFVKIFSLTRFSFKLLGEKFSFAPISYKIRSAYVLEVSKKIKKKFPKKKNWEKHFRQNFRYFYAISIFLEYSET